MSKCKRLPKIGWGALGGLVLYGACAGEDRPPSPAARPATPPPPAAARRPSPVPPAFLIGDRVRIKASAADPVVTAPTQDGFRAMVNAVAARDEAGFGELINEGRVSLLTRNTAGIVLDSDMGSRLVRFTQAPLAGEKGWIAIEFLSH